jgi:GntR family transcriptional regulator/MocR family aminotransferase
VIGAGTQYLIRQLSLIFNYGSSVGIEDPGFHRTRFAFEHSGLQIVPTPLDKHGIRVDQLHGKNLNIVYVTPSHQFPCGMIMPISRRNELLSWAQKNNAYIIEDDYDGEFRYKGRPIPSLQGLDSYDRVIYLGTFSKSLIPSLRMSYMVLPQELLTVYLNKLSIYKQTVSRFHQKTLALFMTNGHWEAHLNRLRTIYRKKQTKLIKSIQYTMQEKVEIIGENSGLHVLLRLRTDIPESWYIKQAANVQIKVYPTSIYRIVTKTKFTEILLGFGGLTEHEIEEGITLLNKAWFS